VILADVNVLIYAFDSDSADHRTYADWLSEALVAREDFALLDTVLSGLVRIVTHPKIMPRPAPTATAVAFVQALITAPASRWLHGSSALWSEFETMARSDRAIRGNRVSDAYIAAAARAHGARIATADRGFARFDGVSWFDPAA